MRQGERTRGREDVLSIRSTSVRSISYINMYAAKREDVLFLTFTSRSTSYINIYIIYINII